MDANILIVDSISGQRRTLENMLKEAGCSKFHNANSAKEAMAILTSEPNINAVITDWDLPDKSGVELLTLIKSNDKLRPIPVFLTFKIRSKADILKASQSGATGFIVKPYQREVIKQKISGIFPVSDTQTEFDTSKLDLGDDDGKKQDEKTDAVT